MDSTFQLLGLSSLIGGALIMLSIWLGMATSRAGMPLLLIFLGVGMLAGEDGIGKIAFDNHTLSFWVANIALAVILFDGGLRTPYSIFRVALKPAVALSTIGVLITAFVLALAAWKLFGMPFGLAFLFGAIVSSTDAAAVFSLLKNSGVRLNERVESALEIESGVNDPMAVLLTVFAISFLTSLEPGGWGELGLGLFVLLLKQLGVGLVVAYLGALGFIRLMRLARAETSHNQGLNALFIVSAGIAIFGLSTVLQGSGFLSIYIFGLVLGNERKRYVKTIVPAMDGLAWLFQAAMFLLLGLLATPHSVLESVGPGIGLALVLMFVARPVAVFACLWPFHFSSKEMLFIAWVGLRGAVPIILAIFPIIAGVDEKKLMLDLALMVVIFSLLFQGSTIAWVARKLSLALPDQQDRQAMRQIFGDFAFDGHAYMDDICAFYGLEISDSGGRTVAQWITHRLAKPPVEGDEVQIDNMVFIVRSLDQGVVKNVGLKSKSG
jgi:cell volume regulation protein A